MSVASMPQRQLNHPVSTDAIAPNASPRSGTVETVYEDSVAGRTCAYDLCFGGGLGGPSVHEGSRAHCCYLRLERFYLGINGGGGSSHKCLDFVAAAGAITPEGCHNATGGTVGGQIGFRQSANWVFGLEGQGNWADFSGDNLSPIIAIPFGPQQRNRSRIDSFGLITRQVGYAWNSVLFYVKGGGAVVGDRYDICAGTASAVPIPVGSLLASARETRWGGTVGAGLEVSFAPNWSVGLEHDHIFLGQDVDIALLRLNYRWGGPVIAKY